MSIIGERLIKVRESKGIDRQTLADYLGVTYNAYMYWESGKRDPNTQTLRKICSYLRISADYLLGLTEDPTIKPSSGRSESINKIVDKYTDLDKYGKRAVDSIIDIEHNRCTEMKERKPTIRLWFNYNKVSAGCGEWLDGNEGEYRDYPDCKVAREADEVIEVQGQSMEPMFYDGDLVFVKRTDYLGEGQIGVFIYKGDGYIKKMHEHYLESINPDYADIYPTEDVAVVYGRVLGRVGCEDE